MRKLIDTLFKAISIEYYSNDCINADKAITDIINIFIAKTMYDTIHTANSSSFRFNQIKLESAANCQAAASRFHYRNLLTMVNKYFKDTDWVKSMFNDKDTEYRLLTAINNAISIYCNSKVTAN